MRGLVQKRITKLLRRFPISLICAGFLPPAVSTGFDKHASESIHAHRRNSSIIPGDWAEQQQRVLRDSATLDSYISSPYVRSLKTFPFQSILSSVTRLGAPRATVAVDFQPWTLGIPSRMFVDIVHYYCNRKVLRDQFEVQSKRLIERVFGNDLELTQEAIDHLHILTYQGTELAHNYPNIHLKVGTLPAKDHVYPPAADGMRVSVHKTERYDYKDVHILCILVARGSELLTSPPGPLSYGYVNF